MNKRKIKAFLITGALLLAFIFIGSSCSSCERCSKSCGSDMDGGLNRIVNVYDYTGNKIASYKGKLDIEQSQSKVLFDMDGKRYIYYNAIVEVIEQ